MNSPVQDGEHSVDFERGPGLSSFLSKIVHGTWLLRLREDPRRELAAVTGATAPLTYAVPPDNALHGGLLPRN